MDPKLMEVARNGDIEALYGLLGEDPFILENVEKIPFTNTPLHWAVLAGHTCLVEEITNLKPSFCLKLNQEGFSPLHLASTSGHVEIVKVLLKDERRLKKLKEAMNVDDSLCNLKGKEKQTPLHCAAIAGRVDVLKVLLSNCPNSITALTVRKETALHLAVKFGRVEVLKVLLDWIGKNWYNDILRKKDQEGNTVLHLATSRGQYEIVEVLLRSSSLLVRNAVRVNARNKENLTALDLLDLLPNEPDGEMRKTLCKVGAKKGVGSKKRQDMESQQEAAARSCVRKWVPKSSKMKHWFRYCRLKVDMDTPSDTRNALLVVVVLIVTATFQTGLNPPGGYWDDTSSNCTYYNSTSHSTTYYSSTNYDLCHFAGEPIWHTYAPITYNLVMLFNFAGFILSLLLSYNLTLGFPLRGPLLIALIFMLLTYSWSTPIFYKDIYNGPAGDDSFLTPDNKMLWLPVVVIVIIWAITANWMGQLWWKFSLLTGRVSH